MAKVSLRTWNARAQSPHFWFVTGFGVGMLKPAPGTWGSLQGLILGISMISLGITEAELIAAVIVVTAISSLSINQIEKAAGIHDAPEIIIDEVAGQWLALVPLVALPHSYLLYTLSFVLFRFFDVLKPWPISWLDKTVTGGFGVMVDDIAAGILAAFGICVLLATGLLDGFI
ncbi:phosphatidylglycerophosphatase A [Kordiimonas sp.]|uniref:phosphatidylglycerophosphatase A family protein n=1 Tax=Kordiimonas sp. TaxID=1970157 RepID=UPI003A90EF7D